MVKPSPFATARSSQPDEHPAAIHDGEVNEVRRRAKLALVAFALTILARTWDLGARAWSIDVVHRFQAGDVDVREAMQSSLERSDELVNVSMVLVNGALVLTAFVFVRWVRQLVRMTRALGAKDMQWSVSQATWGFFIPILSLFRPYQVLRDVQQRLEPEEIEPPAPHVARDAAVDYRNVAMVIPPMAKRVPDSLLGIWWGSFVVMSFLGRFANRAAASDLADVVTNYQAQIVVSVIAIASAALATRVIRGLTARLEERFRRIRHSTPESLARQQIMLG